MSKIKIKEILSFSSEDPAHPASNLLESATFRKWKCKENGESEACVIFQLENAVSITGIDFGNENSANVEVLVSRSGDSSKTFHVLMTAVMLMSPIESRELQNRNRVKMIRKDKLDRLVMAEKWDIVKVVCTQPYNKHTQYGLSFITFFKDVDVNDNKPKIGSFAILPTMDDDDKEESPKMGSLFAKKRMESIASKEDVDKDKEREPAKVSSTVLLRTAPTSSSFGTGNKVQDLVSKSKSPAPSSSKVSEGNDDTNANDTPTTAPAVASKVSRADASSSSPSAPKAVSKSKAQPSPRKLPKKKKKIKPFNKLFEDVTFVMSGFENPYRGELRQKALDMGAKCKPDWNSSCTHLICAFVNTPKFRQVKAAGGDAKIVTNDWIEECFRSRRRLPWRRFCTDRNDRGLDSEEEMLADDCEDSEGSGNGSDHDSSSNSDLHPAKKRKRIQVVESSSDEEKQVEQKEQADDLYGQDTDVEEDPSNEQKLSNNGIFTSTVFYVDPDWSLLQADTRKEIVQIITNGKGIISSTLTHQVEFFITHQDDWNEDFSEALSENPNLTVVKGDWIMECGGSGGKVSHDSFMILPI